MTVEDKLGAVLRHDLHSIAVPFDPARADGGVCRPVAGVVVAAVVPPAVTPAWCGPDALVAM